jgi:hypothetical protein
LFGSVERAQRLSNWPVPRNEPRRFRIDSQSEEEQSYGKFKKGRIVETPTEARQAEPGPSVLTLLTLSLALAIIILGGVWIAFLPHIIV